ncbi:unnamed protein product, partial [Scytosiphon promiscuus]
MKLTWQPLMLLAALVLPGAVVQAQTCSNGLAGYEDNDVCCPLSCGTCGGEGCGLLGDGCCTSEVKDSGEMCSTAGSAPCIIDEDGTADPASSPTCSNG